MNTLLSPDTCRLVVFPKHALRAVSLSGEGSLVTSSIERTLPALAPSSPGSRKA